MRRLAIFDIDGTLILPSTGLLLARGLRAQGVLRRRDVVMGAIYTLRMRMNRVNYEAVAREALAFLHGRQVDEVRGWFEDAFEHHMRDRFCVSAVERLRAHQEAGDRVVLLSGTSQLVGEILGRVLEVDDLICAHAEIEDDGSISDRIVRPVPYAAGKVACAAILAERAGLEVGDAVAYSDSMSDRPILEVVGEAIAVNPDPFLARLARRKGWEILACNGTCSIPPRAEPEG